MARYVFNEKSTSSIKDTGYFICANSGAYTWTVPAGVTCATFEVVGGGGGGGAKCCCDCYHMSSGGSAGAYAKVSMPVTPGSVYSLCVGMGGSQGLGAGGLHWCCFGGDGTTSYITGPNITTLCAEGGYGTHNTCYTYCMCGGSAGCGAIACSPLATVALTGLTAGTFTAVTDACYICSNNGRKSNVSGFTNPYSDSQSQYYAATTGGTAFRSESLYGNEACNLCRPAKAAANNGWPGSGGQGAMNSQNCCCYQAAAGAAGLISITY